MLRRKPTKIEVKIEDKEELEEARRRNTANATTNTTTTTTTGAASLLRQFDRAEDSSSKANRIGLSS
ncbi:putative anaphase-promoting complex, subunit CDC26 [Medicago truncatula]|uniref:Putative anaphase-promoting complex, subunit CDC26 n=1 Tax=Medicago truncatula TaxID=3880 RepID=A0A396IJR3_MEDTR|nr:putative anaphase-promoting complex, subunit CDC26 [Medicago truncatula]